MGTANVERSGALTTAAVSAASGYSPQQVRDLEHLGVIPPARRGSNGYRRFSTVHVLALRAYRNLAAAVGPVAARRGLRDARSLPLDEAAALIGSFHIGLHRERDEALAARRALHLIRGETVAESSDADSMTITELAGALGVRSSTLRFWEQAGLVEPERVTPRGARRYPPAAIREARITAALRGAGYRIPDVQEALRAVRRLHDVDGPVRALDARVAAIARRTLALLTAGTDIVEVVRDGRG